MNKKTNKSASGPGLDVALIEKTFALLAPKGPEIVADFYGRLFGKHPSLRALFRNTSPEKQQAHLLAALGFAVKNLRNPKVLSAALESMGARHNGYGAVEAHYPVVVDTMLESLAKAAGPLWSAQVSREWKTALTAVSQMMISGSKKAALKEKPMKSKSKAATPEISDEAVRYKSSIEGSNTPMIMIDRELLITYANPATVRMVRENIEVFRSPHFRFQDIAKPRQVQIRNNGVVEHHGGVNNTDDRGHARHNFPEDLLDGGHIAHVARFGVYLDATIGEISKQLLSLRVGRASPTQHHQVPGASINQPSGRL